MSTQSAKIYLRACAGFANRLRATVSGICAAEEAGRAIQISWPYERAFVGNFQEFFDMEASQLPSWVTFDQQMDSSKAEVLCLTPEDWHAQAKNTGPIHIKSYAKFYQTARYDFWLRSLKPRREFVERVEEIFRGKPPVGIHIRRTDHWRCIAESPTGEFVRIMDQYPPGTVFFVASDSDEERIVLRAKYSPARILTGATILDRTMTVGTKHAFVDFLALSRCSEIVGSWTSSFSEMAAAYGDVPLRFARAAAAAAAAP